MKKRMIEKITIERKKRTKTKERTKETEQTNKEKQMKEQKNEHTKGTIKGLTTNE